MWSSGLDLRLYRKEKDEGFTEVASDCRGNIYTVDLLQSQSGFFQHAK